MRISTLALAAVLCAATLLADSAGRATADGPISGPPGIIETYAGGGTGGEGSPRLEAAIKPNRLAFSPDGDLYFTDQRDFDNNTVEAIVDDVIVHVAGGGEPSATMGDGGPATNARFQRATGLAFNTDGDLFIADNEHCTVRRVMRTTAEISTVAGRPDHECMIQFVEGVPPTETTIMGVEGIAFDSQGELVIGDMQHCLVRKTQGGLLVTIAGIPWETLPPNQLPENWCVGGGDGPATETGLEYVRDVEVGPDGDLYLITECHLKRVRQGFIKKLKVYLPPLCSTTDAPLDVAVSPTGSAFIAHGNCYVTMFSEGVQTFVVGAVGDCQSTGDGGLSKDARATQVWGVSLDAAGNLFLAERDVEPPYLGRVRVIYGAAADTDGDGYTDAAEANIGEDHTTFCRIMRADVSRDGVVNVADLGRLASQFGPNPEYPRYDQNADTVINPADLGLVASVFGKRPAACP